MSDPTKKQQQAEGLRAVDLTDAGEGPWQVGAEWMDEEGPLDQPEYYAKHENGAVIYCITSQAEAIAVCAALNAVSREETP